MHFRHLFSRIPSRSVCRIAVLGAVVLACSDVATDTVIEPQFAPGGGGPPVKVTATAPDTGEQGTTLVVRVLGANFENGSVAEFRLDGVAPGKVHTNSTTFISDAELLAEITIDGTADLGLYDVEVITPRGKKGVGTELFRVQEPVEQANAETPLDVTLRDDGTDAISSDGAGNYEDGITDVSASLARQFMFGTGGARLAVPRRICFEFGDSATTWFGATGPICSTAIWNTTSHDNDPDGMEALPVGTTMQANSRFIYRDPATDKQIWVQFGDTEDPGLTSPNRVVVRRIDEFTWELESTTQLVRVLREIGRVKGRMQRDTLGFVPMPFRATLRVQN